MAPDDSIDKSMWAMPIFEYVDAFNSANTDVQVSSDAANSLGYVHLHFKSSKNRYNPTEDILYASIVHDGRYCLSGHFRTAPAEFLSDYENKERARRVADVLFSEPFSITDEERATYSMVTPSPMPHLVHRYFKMCGMNEFRASEFYFRPFTLDDFAQNTLWHDLRRFQIISDEV